MVYKHGFSSYKYSKQTIKELSDKINLTPTPVYERIKKLEENGCITGYKAQIDRFSIGLSLMVFCNILSHL